MQRGRCTAPYCSRPVLKERDLQQPRLLDAKHLHLEQVVVHSRGMNSARLEPAPENRRTVGQSLGQQELQPPGGGPHPALHDLQQRLFGNRLRRGGQPFRHTKVFCEEDLPEFHIVMVDVSLLAESSGRTSGLQRATVSRCGPKSVATLGPSVHNSVCSSLTKAVDSPP